MIYSIWEGDGITLKEGPDRPPYPDDADAVKVKEFEASSWDEACQVEYDYYGWGLYRPMEWDETSEGADPEDGTPAAPENRPSPGVILSKDDEEDEAKP